MAWVHNEIHAKKRPISDDFELRSPVIQKQFQTKSAISTTLARAHFCFPVQGNDHFFASDKEKYGKSSTEESHKKKVFAPLLPQAASVNSTPCSMSSTEWVPRFKSARDNSMLFGTY